MFEGFSQRQALVRDTRINFRVGGDGPPLLLLHGYPQTHAAWHKVAPTLAERFTVVCSDLRGYGASDRPRSDPEHRAYSKRTMAADQLAVMRSLGFLRFAVAGHDRGAQVAHRMALDHPDTVTKLAVLDSVPTLHAWERMDERIAMADFHWLFLTQPDDLPETLIESTPGKYLDWILAHWNGTPGAITPHALSEYRRAFDAGMIHASCEDYRAGATIDLEHDRADLERKLECPVLALWSAAGTGAMFDVLAAWRERATDVEGRALDCGHFLPEERPDEVILALRAFLGEE